MADDNIRISLVRSNCKEGTIEWVIYPEEIIDLLSKLFRSMRSFIMGEITPFPLRLAWASKPDGNRSRGRTNVWTLQGSLSGGVGSSSCTIPNIPSDIQVTTEMSV